MADFPSPPVAPPFDDTTYLVLDDFGPAIGLAFRETDPHRADIETVIEDLLSGQYANPVSVIAFNLEDGWSRDATEDIATQLKLRAEIEDRQPAVSVQNFIDRHALTAELALPFPKPRLVYSRR